jgi:hypothetical protein
MRLYTPHGTVQIVRCPNCTLFFITHGWAQRTRCRFCQSIFKINLSPKAKKFIRWRSRFIAEFENAKEARKALAKLNGMAVQGVFISNDEARAMISKT